VSPRHLLDTHVLLRWLLEPERLSREQERTIEKASSQGYGLAISAITLLEIAMLYQTNLKRIPVTAEDLFAQIARNPQASILPMTVDVAREMVAIGDFLRDPMDRAIVSTARVHGFPLLTSDERIIGSRLVPVID
jgi:PIN domain nuclease of toxin-antitoxin system